MRVNLIAADYNEKKFGIFAFPAMLTVGHQTVRVATEEALWCQLLRVVAGLIGRRPAVRENINQGLIAGVRIQGPERGNFEREISVHVDGDVQQDIVYFVDMGNGRLDARNHIAGLWLACVDGGGLDVYVQNEYPCPSFDETSLGRLDREVYRRVVAGQSALQITLSDDLLNVDNGWYNTCIAELRDKIAQRPPWENVRNILAQTKYASKILWFRTAFEDDQFHGDNHAQGFREKLNGGYDFYEPMRDFGLQPPFPFDQSPLRPPEANVFCEYVWFMSGVANPGGIGRASRLTLGLKELCRRGETDLYDMSRLYEREDNLWHVGRDLQIFVGKIRGQENEEVEARWFERLRDVFTAAFPAFNDVDANAGLFLKYNIESDLPPSLIIGIWGTRFDNGYDRIQCGDDIFPSIDFAERDCVELRVEQLNTAVDIEIQGIGNGRDNVPLARVNSDAKCPFDYIPGVYVRSVFDRSGRNRCRRNWWKKLTDGSSVRTGMELLICQRGGVNNFNINQQIQRFYEVGASCMKRITVGAETEAFSLYVLNPIRNNQLQEGGLTICGINIHVRPLPPRISVVGVEEPLVSESDEIICGDNDVLELRGAIEFGNNREWHVGGKLVSTKPSLALKGQPCATPLKVECRVEGNNRQRTIKVVVLPEALVRYLRNPGIECPQEWQVNVSRDLAYVVDGDELCSLCRVNAAGAPITDTIEFRRSCGELVWWLERRNGERMAVRNGIGDVRREDLANIDLAVPCIFLDRQLRCDGLLPNVQPDDFRIPENRRFRRSYRLISLETVVRRLGPPDIYSFGNPQERLISFGGETVVCYNDYPCEICFARDDNTGDVGVYFPNIVQQRQVIVAAFTDNVECPRFDLQQPLHSQKMDVAGGVPNDAYGWFVSLGDFIRNCRNIDPSGEVFAVLVEVGVNALNRECLIGSRRSYKVLEPARNEFLTDNVAGIHLYYFDRLVASLRGMNAECPYYHSRIAIYARENEAALAEESWWFEHEGNIERLDLNACRDLKADEMGHAKLCLTARAMAGTLGGALTGVRVGFIAHDDHLVSRIPIAEIIRGRLASGTIFQFDGQQINRSVFSYERDGLECRVFTYEQPLDTPLICRHVGNGQWGVYVSQNFAVQPILMLYTDDPDSPVFQNGQQIVDVNIQIGFNSLETQIQEFRQQNDNGEIYLALFRENGIDPGFHAGNFLDVDRCQVVCVATRTLEWYPMFRERRQRLNELAYTIGPMFGHYDMVDGNTWSQSRICRLYKSLHDKALQNYVANGDGGFDLFVTRMYNEDGTLSYEQSRNFFRELMEYGFNPLAECCVFNRLFQELYFHYLKVWLNENYQDISPYLTDTDARRLLLDCDPQLIAQCQALHLDFMDRLNVVRDDGQMVIKRLFRDQSIDENVEWHGHGLCAALVVHDDLKIPTRGNCHEMDFNAYHVNGFNICATLNGQGLGQLREVGNEYVFLVRRVGIDEKDNLIFYSNDEWNGFCQCKRHQAQHEGGVVNGPWNGIFNNADAETINWIFLQVVQAAEDNGRISMFMAEMLRQWGGGLVEWPNSAYKTLSLTGLLLAVNLEVTRMGVPEYWMFRRESAGYDLILRIVYTAFGYRHFAVGGAAPWRCLMRAMCGTMGLIRYFNQH